MRAKHLNTMLHRFWKAWGRDLLIVLSIMIPFRSSVADWNYVPSGSMVPSILEGDRIFVNKLAYDLKVPLTTHALATWSDPARGDIAVFFSPSDGTRLVKRVVGLPGDRIAMQQGRLVINGRAADYALIEQGPADLLAMESLDGVEHPVRYTRRGPLPHSFGPVEVPEGHYFLLGDNRDHSADSRVFGPVERSRILGRAPAVVMSFDRDRYYLPRRERWFRRLP